MLVERFCFHGKPEDPFDAAQQLNEAMMSKCKDCGLPLAFQQVNGKLHPTNPDGSDHWDLCSATRIKKVMKNGTPFKDKQGEGFINAGKKTYMLIRSAVITGKHYVPTAFEGLPWEA